ncbi:Fmp32 protein [Maudiozyma humilis]|uniref:Fmp32 protein n=1 Tax=Maudiozyma humilis TaxID=51915 RepID=A0AAV5RR48_MAUHU|nr:Fmp32 protein [Kazachstania humilis]
MMIGSCGLRSVIPRSRFVGLVRPLGRFHTASVLRNSSDEAVHVANTNKYKEVLMSEGDFTEQQSKVIVETITESIRSGVAHVAKDLAKRERLLQLTYQQRVDFAKLRDQLLSSDRNEFYNIQNEYERVKNDLDKLKSKLKEDISKSNAGFKLDLSLEKGRIKEESTHHDLQIKEIDTRIDQEVSNMKMQIDSVKTQVMQWLIGVCTGTCALVLAYIRLLS